MLFVLRQGKEGKGHYGINAWPVREYIHVLFAPEVASNERNNDHRERERYLVSCPTSESTRVPLR